MEFKWDRVASGAIIRCKGFGIKDFLASL